MLRRIPATHLVCLVVLLSTLFIGASWAAGPDESLEVLLKPDKQAASQVPATHKATPRQAAKFRRTMPPDVIPYPAPMGITKVKQPVCMPYQMAQVAPPCILATPGPRQWELGVQVFFAALRGNIMWPRYSQYYSYYWTDRGADLVDHLQLPRHDPVVEVTAQYQFRPNWAIRYSGIFKEWNGGGQSSDYFWFGNTYGYGYAYYGQSLTSKWQHSYQKAGLVYDAIRTCNSKVSVFADWVHADDRIDVGCPYCGYYSQTFSKGTDAASIGLEVKRCLKTMPNGGTFSCEYKAAAIFLDNVEGWDVQAGAKYSIPLNSGNRWGYVKGGYRLVDLKKSQSDYLFKHSLEGGFMEMGFIF